MPLRQNTSREPIVELDIQTVRFPLTRDGTDIVWGEVSDHALRERAMQDGIRQGLEKRELFNRYRQLLEMLASELFDEGKFVTDASGNVIVLVPNGRLSAG
jgi:hypothetical protein